MRTAYIIIKAPVGNKTRQVERAAGSLSYLVDRVSSHAPMVSKSEIKTALISSVWAEGDTWIGGHKVAVSVLEIGEAKVALLHLDD